MSDTLQLQIDNLQTRVDEATTILISTRNDAINVLKTLDEEILATIGEINPNWTIVELVNILLNSLSANTDPVGGTLIVGDAFGLTDSVTLDTFTFKYVNAPSEQLTFTDNVDAIPMWDSWGEETITFGDSAFASALTIKRLEAPADPISITDEVNLISMWDSPVSDDVQFTDNCITLAMTWQYINSPIETLGTLSDNANCAYLEKTPIQEAVGLSDSCTIILEPI